MKVILRHNIGRLGKAGDVKKVKDGYARNYLLPKGLALMANDENISRVSKEKEKIAQQKNLELQKVQEIAARVNGMSCTVAVEAQEDESLYGSVTEADIVKGLEQEFPEIDKTTIELGEPIKRLGIYEVGVRLHPEVTVTIKVWVVRK